MRFAKRRALYIDEMQTSKCEKNREIVVVLPH